MPRSDRVSVFTRRRAGALSDAARGRLDRPPVADDGSTRLRTKILGPDPLRILLFGSGPLIGYGVRTREHAVDGSLGRLLTESTGRGTIIESRVRLGLPVEEAVPSLGGSGTATFGAAVWAPRFSEELRYSTPERYRTAVRAMLDRFRTSSDVPLVVCELPVPLGLDWRTELRRPRVVSFNAVLADEAASVSGVRSVALGPYRPGDAASTPPSWHRGQAALIAPVLLAAIAQRHGRAVHPS